MANIVTGTSGPDTLTGTSGENAIDGGAGNDTIYGSAGADSVNGGANTDNLIFEFPRADIGLSASGCNRTITIGASTVTDSAGQINTTFSNIEQISINNSTAAYLPISAPGATLTVNAVAFAGSGGITIGDWLNTDNLRFMGSAAGDRVAIGAGSHILDGGAGNDSLQTDFTSQLTTITQSGSTLHFVDGTNVSDASNFESITLFARSAGATINASGATQDLIFGASYGITLIGGSGKDYFNNNYSGGLPVGPSSFTGGAGADTYYYTNFGANFDGDTITDFATDDLIDLSGINLFSPNSPVRFIGTSTFSGVVNQLRYIKSGGQTLLQVDANGDGVADGTLTLSNGAFDLAETANGSAILKRAVVNVITGTAGNDYLHGTPGADNIFAVGGPDTIYGSAGSDSIVFGPDGGSLTFDFGDVSTGLSTSVGSRTIIVGASSITDSSGQIATSFTPFDFISFNSHLAPYALSTGPLTFDASSFAGLVSFSTVQNAPVTFMGNATRNFVKVGAPSFTVDGGAGEDSLTVATMGGTTVVTEINGGWQFANGTNIGTAINFENVLDIQLFAVGSTVDASAMRTSVSFQADYSGTLIGGSGANEFRIGKSPDSPNYADKEPGGPVTMTGGDGNDIFIFGGYRSSSAFKGAGRQNNGVGSSFYGEIWNGSVITDFAAGDQISLQPIQMAGPFSPKFGPEYYNPYFLGTAAFDGQKYAIRYETTASSTLIQIDGNGDKVVDATITLSNGAFDLMETSLGSGILRLFPLNIITGTAAGEAIAGTAGPDNINAFGGDDTIIGGHGNDIINGGAGFDTLVYSISHLQAIVTTNADGSLTINAGVDGTDIVSNVENFRFSDGTYSYSGGGRFNQFTAPDDVLIRNFAVGAGGWSSQDTYPRHLADVNGDGYADIVGFGYAGMLVSLGAANRSFAAPVLATANFNATTGWTSDNLYHRTLADVNGDGKADIIGFGYGGTLVSLAKAGGGYTDPLLTLNDFGKVQGWTSQDGFARVVGDVNGDGKADIVGFGYAGALVSLGNGDGTFKAPVLGHTDFGVEQGWTNDDGFHRELADVNGDGKADLIGFGTVGTYVALSNGDGTFKPTILAVDDFGKVQGWTSQDALSRFVGDVNGDGYADIVGFGIAGTLVAYGKANGTFSAAILEVADFGQKQGWTSDAVYHRELADINHDGLLDIMGFGYAGVLAGINQGGQFIL